MKKRGEITLWFFVELIGAFLVAYLAVSISTAQAKGTVFEQLNIAKDIGMQINALNSLPGDAFISGSSLHGYSIKITGNRIEVFESESDLVKGAYYFVNTHGSSINFLLKNSAENPKTLAISKINGKISLSEEISNLKQDAKK